MRAWVVGLVVALCPLPSGAVPPWERPPPPAPVALPGCGALEELLLGLADASRPPQAPLLVPSLPLAVRTGAWAFVPPGGRAEAEAREVLSLLAQDARVEELPAGRQLAFLLDPTGEVQQLRMRELGPWLRRPSGPLQGLAETLLARFPGGKTAGLATLGTAALGLAYQFGTGPAPQLGLTPAFSATALRRRLRTSVRLEAEPGFRTVRAGVATQLHLPEALQLSLLGAGRLELLEVGAVTGRTPEGLLLEDPWARVRGHLAALEVSAGVRSSHTEPGPWVEVEARVRRERYGLRTAVSHQPATGRSLTTTTATVRLAPVVAGGFLHFDGTARRMAGLVGMAIF